MPTTDPYDVLGIARGASAAEVKQAWRDLAKVWHPDRFAGDPRLGEKAAERLKEINRAYERIASGKTAPLRQDNGQSREAPHAGTTRAWQAHAHDQAVREARGFGARHHRRAIRAAASQVVVWFLAGSAAVVGALILTQDHRTARTVGDAISWTWRAAAGEAAEPAPSPPVPSAAHRRTSDPASEVLRGNNPPAEHAAPSPVIIEAPNWDEIAPAAASHPTFTLGDSASTVRKVQGQPDRIADATWHYGRATITFVRGRVGGYSNPDGDLHVAIRAGGVAAGRRVFTVGSSRDLVLALQGTPTAIVGDMWFYGASSVSFSGTTVAGYANVARNLKVGASAPMY